MTNICAYAYVIKDWTQSLWHIISRVHEQMAHIDTRENGIHQYWLKAKVDQVWTTHRREVLKMGIHESLQYNCANSLAIGGTKYVVCY